MLSWLRQKLNPKDKAPIEQQDVEGWQFRVGNDQDFHANRDIISGLRFHATLHLTTPLSVLQHHGEVFDGPPSEAPAYGTPAQGIWIHETRSWRELGIDIDDWPESTAASDIGPVLASTYVPFLIRFRSIVESNLSLADKRSAFEQLKDESTIFSGIWKLAAQTKRFPERFLE